MATTRRASASGNNSLRLSRVGQYLRHDECTTTWTSGNSCRTSFSSGHQGNMFSPTSCPSWSIRLSPTQFNTPSTSRNDRNRDGAPLSCRRSRAAATLVFTAGSVTCSPDATPTAAGFGTTSATSPSASHTALSTPTVAVGSPERSRLTSRRGTCAFSAMSGAETASSSRGREWFGRMRSTPRLPSRCAHSTLTQPTARAAWRTHFRLAARTYRSDANAQLDQQHCGYEVSRILSLPAGSLGRSRPL